MAHGGQRMAKQNPRQARRVQDFCPINMHKQGIPQNWIQVPRRQIQGIASHRKCAKLIRKAFLNYPRLTGTGILSHWCFPVFPKEIQQTRKNTRISGPDFFDVFLQPQHALAGQARPRPSRPGRARTKGGKYSYTPLSTLGPMGPFGPRPLRP